MAVILRAVLERQRRGLSQSELAHRLGVSQTRLSEVERGLRTEPVLRAMEQFFSMKREILLRPIPDSLNPEARSARFAAELEATALRDAARKK